MAGRFLLPAFPETRALPWLLGGASAALLLYGFFRGDSATTAIGAVGLAGCVIAFPLSRLLLGDEPAPEPASLRPADEPPTDGPPIL